MGIGGISIWQLLIILLIVVLIFGTKRLKNIGGDLGGAMKSFKDAVNEDDNKTGENQQEKTLDNGSGDASTTASDESQPAEKEPHQH